MHVCACLACCHDSVKPKFRSATLQQRVATTCGKSSCQQCENVANMQSSQIKTTPFGATATTPLSIPLTACLPRSEKSCKFPVVSSKTTCQQSMTVCWRYEQGKKGRRGSSLLKYICTFTSLCICALKVYPSLPLRYLSYALLEQAVHVRTLITCCCMQSTSF